MAAGEHTRDGLTPRQQERIEHAVSLCRSENGLDVSVLVGDLDLPDLSQFRAATERLHAALGDRSPTAVLLVIAPGQRRVEVVTGPGVRRRVPDRVCALTILSMTSAFVGGDLTGGILDALRQIAESAGRRAALTPVEQVAGGTHGSVAVRGSAAPH